MCNMYIPEVMRKPLFDTYGSWFSCNLEEAVVSDVTQYKTFNEYFVRKLKPGARDIDPVATLVSNPCVLVCLLVFLGQTPPLPLSPFPHLPEPSLNNN